MTIAIDMAGKVALVTGASRGIGRSIALEMARAGCRVACFATSEERSRAVADECSSLGVETLALGGDVADPAAAASAVERTIGELGRLDVLVNNAGITRDGLLMRMSDEDFDRVLAVNLRGAFLTCRAAARPMTKQRSGRIVNVASIVGIMGNAGQANYAASKAGIIGFTKSLAKELGGRGITANVVAPGFITTDMTKDLSAEIKAGSLAGIPLARFGDPEDVARAVLFLASDLAAYVTGQVLAVDGGMAM
jgi:3-oxoacyl-[acyl-carrier protein] reductase